MEETDKLFRRLSLSQKQEVIVELYDYNGSRISRDCQNCAACCLAFSIPGLREHGERCPHLKKSNGRFSCEIYPRRPSSCKSFDCRRMPTNTPFQRLRLRELFAAKKILAEGN